MRIDNNLRVEQYKNVKNVKNVNKTQEVQKINEFEPINKDIEISKAAKEVAKKISEKENKEYTDKVESIKLQILKGEYKVSSKGLAEKILEKAKEDRESL